MLKEGIFLGKRYEICERIGSGGMADVYKGKDHKLNRYVAIKVLKSDFRSDETFIQKFLSEAQAAAGLMHPNVVNVYDVGQDRGLYYMVMELVEGITLKEYIEKKGRLSAKETISISIQMVTGIQAAHNQHIVHRDIKPQNIIISKDGKVKVTDFGIARATTSSQTISTSVMGSVHYTSPEQARGGVVDEKSDIYSAGITMYEMITGHVPFDGDSTVSVAIKHLQEEIVAPSVEVPDIPKSLEKIIIKCTQKSTAMRYQNCEALILDLKRSLMDPNGAFIGAAAKTPSADSTVLMSTQEMEQIQEYHSQNGEEYDDYDDGYDEDDDQDDDDRYSDRYRQNERERDRSGSRGGSRSGDGGRSGSRNTDPRNKKEEVDPQMKKVTKILMVAAAAVIAIGVIFGVGRALGAFGKSTSSVVNKESKVEVPNVLGMTKDKALETLKAKSLGMESTTAHSDEYEAGEIISQNPESGEKVDKNTTVKCVISSGPETKEASVPDVAGQGEDAAKKTLEKAGFEVETATENSDSVTQGKAIRTDPASGTLLTEGDTVTLYISIGKERTSVPSLLGKTQDEAVAALDAAGLATGSVTEEYSDEYEAGQVMNQSVEEGKQVDKWTTVDYVISLGKETKMVDVPNLNGMTQEAAEQALSSVGLKAEFETVENTVTAGYVVSWSAMQMEEGGTVVVQISSGPSVPETPSGGNGSNENNGSSSGGSGSGGSSSGSNGTGGNSTGRSTQNQ